jgi:hypothetical protein
MKIVHNKSSKYGDIDFENAFVLQNRSTTWEVSKKSRKLLSKIGISMLLMQGNDFRSLGSLEGDLSITLNLYLGVCVTSHERNENQATMNNRYSFQSAHPQSFSEPSE